MIWEPKEGKQAINVQHQAKYSTIRFECNITYSYVQQTWQLCIKYWGMVKRKRLSLHKIVSDITFVLQQSMQQQEEERYWLELPAIKMNLSGPRGMSFDGVTYNAWMLLPARRISWAKNIYRHGFPDIFHQKIIIKKTSNNALLLGTKLAKARVKHSSNV